MVLHIKIFCTGAVQISVYLLLILIIKSKNDRRAVKKSLKLNRKEILRQKIRILYRFKIDLFDNSNMEEFLLFLWNFKMTIKDLGMFTDNLNQQYICKLLHREVLRRFDTLCAQVGSTTITHLKRVILGLGTYSTSINILSKQKRMMRRRMREPRELKVRCYSASLIDLNEYFSDLPGAKASDKIGEKDQKLNPFEQYVKCME